MHIDEFTVRGFIDGVAVDRWCSGGDGCGGRTPQRVAFSRFASPGGINKELFKKDGILKVCR
jgi:hypothetical protein